MVVEAGTPSGAEVAVESTMLMGSPGRPLKVLVTFGTE
jgi:hypothetical protein